MLQEIMENIHNYFIRRPYPGVYAIKDGMLTVETSGTVSTTSWGTLLDAFANGYGVCLGISAPTVSPALELKECQRFLIYGSDMNDGVYTWHSFGISNDDDTEVAGLTDETFAGVICALAVPPNVIALSAEIGEWVEKYSDAVSGPYQSESFNEYSYTLKSGGGSGSNGGNDGQLGWQDVYRRKLDRWRRPFL